MAVQLAAAAGPHAGHPGLGVRRAFLHEHGGCRVLAEVAKHGPEEADVHQARPGAQHKRPVGQHDLQGGQRMEVNALNMRLGVCANAVAHRKQSALTAAHKKLFEPHRAGHVGEQFLADVAA